MARFGGWGGNEVAARLALVFVLGCNGDKDETGDIIPKDDADADTDADSDADADADSDSDTDVPERCEPIPVDPGATLVGAGEDLAAAVAGAGPGDTLALADGSYPVTAPIPLAAIAIVSQSGDRDGVTIDGGGAGGHLFEVVGSDVTIAHVTLARSYDDLVHAAPAGTDVTNLRLHDVHFLDPGHAAVYVTDDGAGHYVDDSELSCSLIELTNDGRDAIRGTCDLAGIDAYGADGWIVRDNVFDGLWCDGGMSDPTIRFTRGSRGTEIVRNILRDVAFGIVVGETQDQIGRTWPDVVDRCGPTVLQHVDAFVANNLISAFDDDLVASDDGVETGIRAESSCDATVLHNSVYAAIAPESSIDHRYATTTGVFGNNLASHAIRRLDGSLADDDTNVSNASDATWFFPSGGDFHTAPGADWAIDQGSTDYLALVPDDIDGEARDAAPDVGADEVPAP